MVNQVVPYFDDRVDVPTLYWWELGLYCLVFVRPQQNSAAVFRDFFSIQMFFFFFFDKQTRIYKKCQSKKEGHTPSTWEVYKGCQNNKKEVTS